MTNKEVIKIDNAILSCKEAKIATKRGKALFLPLAKDVEDAKSLIITISKRMDSTINKLVWLPEYESIAEWMVNPKKGLILTGDSGRLKTVFATLILPVLYMMNHSYRIKSIKAWQIAESMNQVLSHPVVIIDDVGVESPANEYGVKYEPFSRIVDECERLSKLLIVTTNLNSEELKKRYGNRPIDRLDLLCTPVVFNGKSFR